MLIIYNNQSQKCEAVYWDHPQGNLRIYAVISHQAMSNWGRIYAKRNPTKDILKDLGSLMQRNLAVETFNALDITRSRSQIVKDALDHYVQAHFPPERVEPNQHEVVHRVLGDSCRTYEVFRFPNLTDSVVIYVDVEAYEWFQTQGVQTEGRPPIRMYCIPNLWFKYRTFRDATLTWLNDHTFNKQAIDLKAYDGYLHLPLEDLVRRIAKSDPICALA